MAITPVVMTPTTPLGTTAAAVYTCPVSVTALVRAAVITNTDSASRTVRVYRVPAAGSPSVGNTVISDMGLAPGQAYIANELMNMVLPAGASIYAASDVAGKVNVTMSGFTL